MIAIQMARYGLKLSWKYMNELCVNYRGKGFTTECINIAVKRRL